VEEDSKTVGLRREDLEVLNSPPTAGSWTPGNWTKLSQLYGADFTKIVLPAKLSPAVKYILERQRSKFQ
jgi:hypothetical protein